jgi:hypothetical protein
MLRSTRLLSAVVMSLGAIVAAGAQAPETAEEYQGPAAEQFLTKARIRQVRPIGEGITAPQKVTLEMNGVTRSAAFKSIDEKRSGFTRVGPGAPEANFQDSWQLEIPAYTIDRIIGLGWVPATVERRVGQNLGSLQWWVESMMPEAKRLADKLEPPDAEDWNRKVFKMRLFDQLICNTDRHSNNILITKDWDLRLIDHSRSFRPNEELREPEKLTRFSRSLLDGIQRLEYTDLKKRTSRYLTDPQVRAVMKRRDAILALAKAAVAARGEAAVIYP